MRVRRAGFTSIVAVLTLGAIALLLVAVSSAPAGNRTATATFESFPGPAQVTFGKNVSYRATLSNDSGSTFTQIKFSMTTPSTTVTNAAGQAATLTATLVYSSCEANHYGPFTGTTTTGYSCPTFPNLPANSPGYDVTLIWATPALPTGATCGAGQCDLSTVGTWTIKESNNTTPSTDTFSATVTNQMLVQPNPVKSAGYALGAVSAANCTTSTANVVTNQTVGSANKIATAVCAGTLPGTTLNPGVVVEINERPGTTGELGFTDVSTICIPSPGSTCPLPTNVWTFTPALATFIFRIPETSDWPNGEKLDVAYHNNVQYFGCTFDRDAKTKIWTVVCPASTNGDWRFN